MKGFPITQDRASVCLTDEDLRLVARSIFVVSDKIRASESDYEETVKILRELYNFGRCRGVCEGRD